MYLINLEYAVIMLEADENQRASVSSAVFHEGYIFLGNIR
jgi:hypothetical protein